jgi:hypothetical protein
MLWYVCFKAVWHETFTILFCTSKIFSLGVHMVPLGVHLDTQVALKKCPVSNLLQYKNLKIYHESPSTEVNNIAYW